MFLPTYDPKSRPDPRPYVLTYLPTSQTPAAWPHIANSLTAVPTGLGPLLTYFSPLYRSLTAFTTSTFKLVGVRILHSKPTSSCMVRPTNCTQNRTLQSYSSLHIRLYSPTTIPPSPILGIQSSYLPTASRILQLYPQSHTRPNLQKQTSRRRTPLADYAL